MFMPAALLADLLSPRSGVIGVVILVLDILAIISVLRGSGTTEHKILWTVLILLLPCVGLVLYLLFGRGRGDAPML